jgi:hypothetical protein
MLHVALVAQLRDCSNGCLAAQQERCNQASTLWNFEREENTTNGFANDGTKDERVTS